MSEVDLVNCQWHGKHISFEDCPCGKPARYTSPDGGSCNKYQRCKSYDELLAESKLNEKCSWAYRNFVNEVDDYFEYRNESVKDRKKVHQLLQNLTEKLVEIERSR